MARGLGTRGRFAVAYLLLGAAVGVAVGGLIVLVQRSGPTAGPPWSSWQPAAGSTDSRVLEIAQHIGSSYRSPTGDPLVAVKVGGAQNGNDFAGVAIVKKDNPRALDKSFDPENTAVFILCGDNPSDLRRSRRALRRPSCAARRSSSRSTRWSTPSRSTTC